MSGTEHHRGLERAYRAAPCNRDLAPTIHVGDGRAEISFSVDERLHHGGGAVHGHVLFKALDDAAFFAASSRVKGEMVVTTTYHVHLLRPVRQGRLVARGHVVSRSRRLVVAEAVVLDERDRDVARGSGTFMPSGIELEAMPGYGPESKSPSTDR